LILPGSTLVFVCKLDLIPFHDDLFDDLRLPQMFALTIFELSVSPPGKLPIGFSIVLVVGNVRLSLHD
jgi:hypothetical protein